MGKNISNISLATRICRKSPCHIAYTLNNSQPVTCTIVSDQPFFYLDEEPLFEDDDIFEEESFATLEEDLRELRTKIDSYEKLSRDFIEPEDQTVQNYISTAEDICKPNNHEKGNNDGSLDDNHLSSEGSISGILEILQKSRFAEALLQCAYDHDVKIALCTQVTHSYYDRKVGTISLSPGLELTDQVLLLAMELRRHWQHRNGVLVNPLSFHPDQAILVNRAQHADLAAQMVRIAWELQLAGVKEIWARIENSSFSDLGRALAREAHLDFRTLNNGQASAAVFESWFLSDRCKTTDKHVIESMLSDHEGYVLSNEQSSKMVSADLISALGSVPFGKNYLAQYAQMILEDPIFTEIRDRSNANFLWFIKFEQSFLEAEQELQNPCELHNQEAPLGIITKIVEDTDNEHTQAHREDSGVVVKHPRHTHSSGQKGLPGSTDLERHVQGPNVIYVQFGTPDL